jgi:hypothetical protein
VARDDWDEERSSYADVLESLDAVIHAHPAKGRRSESAEPPSPRPALPDNVIDLRSRLTPARASSLPDDAA